MGTAERKAREKESRRREILSAARALFLDKGYDSTTMPEIARAAELAPGTLYLYFPSKESLYLELLDEGYALLLEHLRGSMRTAASPARQAARFIDAFFSFARENASYFDIIFFVVQRERKMVEQLFAQSELHERLAARQNECKSLAARLIAGPGARDASLTVDALWSMLAGVVLYFIREEPREFERVAGRAKELILRGLFPPGARGGKGGGPA